LYRRVLFVVFVLQISFREDGQGQWASEGVQLGGRGSAMGVIGLWTGAEHELSDPLGTYAQFFFFKHNHHHRLINQSIPLVPRLFPPVALFFFQVDAPTYVLFVRSVLGVEGGAIEC